MSELMNYSVALCTFNGGKYIESQIQSIVSQTIPPKQIVICDDRSHDNTNDLINQFIVKYPSTNWLHIINDINIGYIRNFEKAIKLCNEEIIFLSDQDDVWLTNKAEIILNYFEKNKYSIIFTNAEMVTEDLENMGKTMFEKTNFNKNKKKRFHYKYEGIYFLITNNVVTGATMAFKTKDVLPLLPTPICESFIHDSWIATLGSCLNLVDFIDLPLIKYRQHSDQMTARKIANKDEELLNKKKSTLLLEMLNIKMKRERKVFLFLSNNTDMVESNLLKCLEIRNVLYKNLFRNRRNFINKLKILNYYYYKYRMPEFNTFRMFIGNAFNYIFR